VIKQDILGNRVKLVYLGIGSNLGNRKLNIEKAKFKIFQKNIIIIKSSSYYETPSWPNPNNPKYLNIVLKVFTTFTPLKLLRICKEIEVNLGRKKKPRNSPRECDIDIIDYDNKQIKKNIIIPHPRMHKRNFVLFPLYELNKSWKHPISNLDIKSLIFTLSSKDIRSIKHI
tara:strand:+ start:152 stop:664 length:513 start_codon:yes stop_codon:yes gene_type:complete